MATPHPPASDRAAQRLAAWAQHHPQAAALARLASLAVRVDASLLRRLRLQLLPLAEPGIEADLWFAGLQASQGGDSLVFDAAVQQVLRSQLCAAAAAPGQPRPLQAAWDITRSLHTRWPEALRVEEAITFLALQGGDGMADAIAQALQPALAAMAHGGEARALEIARWAQRAMPRLPPAARQHPAVLALWLGALVRLGATSGPLPAPGEGGLPPALRWLLPSTPGTALLRVACRPLADGLRLQPLADDEDLGTDDQAQQITLPAGLAGLLAVASQDAAGQARHHTLLLQGDTTVPLAVGWQQVTLHNLAGQRWRLQRQVQRQLQRQVQAQAQQQTQPATPPEPAPPPGWQQVQVQVLGPQGPVGLGCFMSPTEVVTVAGVLPADMLQAMRAGKGLTMPDEPLHLLAWGADGRQHPMQAWPVALDLRSALVLLALRTPFADAVVMPCGPGPTASKAPVWLVAGPPSDGPPWPGTLQPPAPPPRPPANQPAPDALAQHMAVRLHKPPAALAATAGAPVLAGQVLVGLADVVSPAGGSKTQSTVLAIPGPAIARFLQWARDHPEDRPRLLLQHAMGDIDRHSDAGLRRVIDAAAWARINLVQASADGPASSTDADQGSFPPGMAGAVLLIHPASRDLPSTEAHLRLLALAARRWERPDFPVLQLRNGIGARHDPLPPPLARLAVSHLDQLPLQALARQLLDLRAPASPWPDAAGLLAPTQAWLAARCQALARPFAPDAAQLAQVLALAQGPADDRLAAVAERVAFRWNSSSRLDAVPLVEALAQLALPLGQAPAGDDLLAQLRDAAAGAWVLNAMPAQLGRLLLSRAHASLEPPPCIIVREQSWQGADTVAHIHQQVVGTLGTALNCSADDASTLLQRMALAPWVLVTTRPLPDAGTWRALTQRLPSARFLFLAGPQPGLADQAHQAGLRLLPPLDEGADLRWLAAFKRLMEWARPSKRAAAQSALKSHKPRR